MARVIGTLAAAGDTQAPTQPQNLQATAINRQRVDLTWTASTDNVGVTGYQIFRNGSPLDTTASTTYSDTTVTASTTYTYAVVAFDAAGNNSQASANAQATTPANASPSWQSIPTQTLIVGDSYSLNLNSVCSDADADTIQYSIPSGTLPSGITRTGSVISGVPTTAGQTPTITVRAFDGFVNVDTTIAFATYTADVTAPPVPTGLAAIAVSSTQINVSWSASTDAAGGANEFVSGTQDYRVYRSTDQTNFSLRTTVTSTSYSDTGLSATTRYDYKITARDVELNESAQSSAVNATTPEQSISATFAADLLARTSMPGVVWFHLFESDAELNAFRWMNGVGNDPNATGPNASNARILAGQGPSGSNCLEFIYPAGTSQPTTLWWRPTAPLNTGSGKPANDPAASGTLTVRAWNPTSSTSHTSQFAFGWYGNALYADADLTHFDGNEFFFQVRIKADPRRITGGNEASQFGGGKLVWFTTAEGAQSLSGGEHVTWSYGRGGSAANQGADKNYVRVYVHQTTGIGPFDPLDQEEPGTRIQPGSDSADDWYYSGGWDTLLYHVRPGQIGVTSGANSTRLRIYAAREGETSYLKIWDQEYGIDSYEARNGLQAVILSAYNNSFDFPQEFFHRYAQPIFSKQFIPCPASPPTWAANMALNTWTALGTDTFNRVGAANIGQNGTGNFSMVFRAWNGAAVMNYGTHKSVGFWGGGHQDYYGNEFYRFDLSTLLYERMTDPSMANGGSWSGPFTNGILSDGTPSSAHTYNFQCGRGSTFVLGKRQVTNTPSSVNMISVFNPATLSWTNSTASPGISPTSYDGMCYDSTRDLVWMIATTNLNWASYNFNTNTWTAYTQPTGSFSEPGVGPVYVAGKDMVLSFVNASNTLLGLDPANPTANSVTLTRTGTPPPVVSRGSGACWSSNLNAVVYWHENSNTIHLLTPPSGDWRTGTWTWSQRSVTGTSGNHTGNGAFNKFQVVEWGAVTVAVLFDDHANPPRGVRLL